MSVTYVSAADRDGWLAVESARRGDARQVLLGVTSFLCAFRIAVCYSGRLIADGYAESPQRAGESVGLSCVNGRAGLAVLLGPVFPGARERRAAHTSLYHCVCSR